MWLRGMLVVTLVLPACAGGAASSGQAHATPPAAAAAEADAREAAASITAADVDRHIGVLAHDSMRGRDTPSPGLDRAAAYVADRLRSYGLQPGADSGRFIQRWPYQQVGLDTEHLSFGIRTPAGVTSPRYREDFFVLPSGTDSVTGELVYAGTARPGLTMAPAAGRIVAFYLPGGGLSQEWGAGLGAALQASMASGAAGALLILDPAFDPVAFAGIANEVADEIAPLPLVGVRYEVAKAVLASAGHDLDALRSVEPGGLVSLGASAYVRATQTGTESGVPNVIAVLPGSDPPLRDTYVVYSAHIDHVGVGTPDETGDSIYNGADDDASGTTALLEVAEAFTRLDVRPARTIVFLGVSGEEKGLLGSAYFTEHPTLPLERMVANINIDMIGRNAPDTVVAIGQDYSSLGPIVQRIVREHPELRLVVAPDLWPEERLFFRSDHFNFARNGVAAIFFTTGLHDDYHRPSDEPDTIDDDKLARVARLVFHLGHAIATDPEAPTWTERGRAEVGAMTGR